MHYETRLVPQVVAPTEGPVTAVVSTSEPYDCNAGYSNWEAGWSPDKKGWCCTNKHMGCPAGGGESTTTTTTGAGSEPFDCDAGYSNWQAGWSPDKKTWCCQNKQKGCA